MTRSQCIESTRRLITPILKLTYGEGSMVDGLADHLVRRIDARDYDERGREHMILQECWMWFPGGDTAASVARKVEAALCGRTEPS